MKRRRGLHALSERMPASLGSVRFRLAAIYSLVLFALAAVAVAALYLGIRWELTTAGRATPSTQVAPGGEGSGADPLQVESIQHRVDERLERKLGRYSLAALGGLLVSGMVVGWVVAGRVLRPLGRITTVVRDIQATDLSRRVALAGPRDELRDLADTFDGMLDRLEDAFDSQRRFIQDTSHELRNPLAVMRTNVDVALADPSTTPAELRQTVEVVGRSAERMSRIVDDLLTYAREGLPDLRWEEVALHDVAAEVAEEFGAPAHARDLRLELQLTPGVSVTADRAELRRVLANLLGNAVRLAPAGSTITVSNGQSEGWAFLAVADEGPGIAPEHHKAVFERFFRAPGQPMATGARNTGLGLPIVADIVRRHAGRMDLVSELGKGSTFVVWLPALSLRFRKGKVGTSS